MPVPAHLSAFWERFRAQAGPVDPARFYESFYFGDSEAMADSLAALVLAGTKRATAASVWSFEAAGKRGPEPGDLSIMTNWAGTPLAVIETARVDVVPFDEVGAEFAAAEGEGDGSLTYWREGHERYFTRECAGFGRTFVPDMPVSCEHFTVVYQET